MKTDELSKTIQRMLVDICRVKVRTEGINYSTFPIDNNDIGFNADKAASMIYEELDNYDFHNDIRVEICQWHYAIQKKVIQYNAGNKSGNYAAYIIFDNYKTDIALIIMDDHMYFSREYTCNVDKYCKSFIKPIKEDNKIIVLNRSDNLIINDGLYNILTLEMQKRDWTHEDYVGCFEEIPNSFNLMAIVDYYNSFYKIVGEYLSYTDRTIDITKNINNIKKRMRKYFDIDTNQEFNDWLTKISKGEYVFVA